MRMILDELKETRKDNEELQKLLKTQLKDDLKTKWLKSHVILPVL